MALQALKGCVIVLRDPPEPGKLDSGLYVPEQSIDKSQSGTVVTAGDGNEVMDVAPGDRVLFNEFAGTEIELDGVSYLRILETDILGVFEVSGS